MIFKFWAADVVRVPADTSSVLVAPTVIFAPLILPPLIFAVVTVPKSAITVPLNVEFLEKTILSESSVVTNFMYELAPSVIFNASATLSSRIILLRPVLAPEKSMESPTSAASILILSQLISPTLVMFPSLRSRLLPINAANVPAAAFPGLPIVTPPIVPPDIFTFEMFTWPVPLGVNDISPSVLFETILFPSILILSTLRLVNIPTLTRLGIAVILLSR